MATTVYIWLGTQLDTHHVCLCAPGNCTQDVPTATQGCKDVGLDYMRKRFVPLFMCAFAFGCCQVRSMVAPRFCC